MNQGSRDKNLMGKNLSNTKQFQSVVLYHPQSEIYGILQIIKNDNFLFLLLLLLLSSKQYNVIINVFSGSGYPKELSLLSANLADDGIFRLNNILSIQKKYRFIEVIHRLIICY